MPVVRSYIGLGSNLQNPIQQINSAIEGLAQMPQSSLIKCSSFYKSPPMGPQDQPDYINAVAAVDTQLTAQQLLQQLFAIEEQHGRQRGPQRWTARTLDLDLLLYEQEIINSAELIVPHPGIVQRNFVLYPLFEIAPQISIPQHGLISTLIAGCERGDLVKLQDNTVKKT